MAATVMGLFREPGPALAAAVQLQDAGFPRPELMSPIPVEGVQEALGEDRSAIKRFTFFGALFGGLFGFVMAAGTAVLYLHPTGGRPIITLPPFLIITYEMTILFGILATVVGFLISARLPAVKERAYLPQSAVDRIAVAVACSGDDEVEQALKMLSEAGAQETRRMEEGA